jgi:hypothetical protein
MVFCLPSYKKHLYLLYTSLKYFDAFLILCIFSSNSIFIFGFLRMIINAEKHNAKLFFLALNMFPFSMGLYPLTLLISYTIKISYIFFKTIFHLISDKSMICILKQRSFSSIPLHLYESSLLQPSKWKSGSWLSSSNRSFVNNKIKIVSLVEMILLIKG